MFDLSWVLGRARVSFTNCAKPVTIVTKSGQSVPLPDLVKDVTPPCHLNPLLFNGHLQTAYTVVKGYDIPVIYKRKVFTSNNPAVPGSFAVDFVHRIASEAVDSSLPPRTTYFTEQEFGEIGSDDSKPMLVTLHGLAGGSNEIYLRHVLAPLTTEEGGWEACVVNSRGCAMSKITSNVLYNARATWDVRQVVNWLREKFPNRPLFGIGFSLGANIMTNYLGEEGDGCQLKAAVVCSNPWNLDVSSQALKNSWMGLNVYQKAMGSSMRRLFERHAEAIEKNPNIDSEEVRRCVYLYEFDRAVQCGSWGYPTENAYYRDASSCDSMLAIRIPFLAINAQDDPISVNEAIPYDEFKQNPYAVLCATSLGGHLSWFQSNGDRWFAKAVGIPIILSRPYNLNTQNANGTADGRSRAFVFEPMRRKLHIPKDHAE
ncbi:alpha beta fold family [Neofusicoccum parvum]|uniref:alcohol O-acetyltransferase n=2 Tax=Neofusicoccum parvum TaxID=310453 RepID=R1G445_BOTPV|nr:putative alpha beta fold family protein [Neofusicoccum parvum UCRNP2]GME44817.1 alpha beta fold family [Neofusicoccum parvum]GME59859.1 alpha beta fold family [Neofusicoccum parvum]